MLVDLPEIPDRAPDGDEIPNEVCRCGSVHPWAWWEPDPENPAHRSVSGRWFVPAINPCARCEVVDVQREADLSVRRRQERAGVPRRLQAYRIDRKRVQHRDEDLGIFAHGVLGERDVIGVTSANWATFEAVRQWTPGKGGMYLEGRVGSGKSLLAAALVTSMLTVDELRRVEMSAEEIAEVHGWHNVEAVRESGRAFYFARHAPRMPVLTTEAELMARVRLGWSGDKDPLLQLSQADVLVLDDMGTEGTHEKVVEAIERLIVFRYENELPTFITSNLAWERVSGGKAPIYGARVASRLKQMVTKIHVLAGIDWRDPPDPVDRKPRQAVETEGRTSPSTKKGPGHGADIQPPLLGE